MMFVLLLPSLSNEVNNISTKIFLIKKKGLLRDLLREISRTHSFGIFTIRLNT